MLLGGIKVVTYLDTREMSLTAFGQIFGIDARKDECKRLTAQSLLERSKTLSDIRMQLSVQVVNGWTGRDAQNVWERSSGQRICRILHWPYVRLIERAVPSQYYISQQN